METRKLTSKEMERLASGLGVEHLAVTCEGDCGYGPCGTYVDWVGGKCSNGHEIGISVPDDDTAALASQHEDDRFGDDGEAAYGREE